MCDSGGISVCDVVGDVVADDNVVSALADEEDDESDELQADNEINIAAIIHKCSRREVWVVRFRCFIGLALRRFFV
jgi:hypothetical protein